MYSQFQDEFKFEDRLNMAVRLMEKFEGRVPCVVERSNNWKSRNINDLDLGYPSFFQPIF